MTTLTVNNGKIECFFLNMLVNMLVFIVFLYLLQTLQYILTYLDFIENVSVLF